MRTVVQEPVIRDGSAAGTGEITVPVAGSREVAGSAIVGVRGLDAPPEVRHPLDPHHFLVLLAVHPDGQNRGIGSTAPERHHHARLDRAGLPAILEANDSRHRDSRRRHRTERRPVIPFPEGSPRRPIGRAPMP